MLSLLVDASFWSEEPETTSSHDALGLLPRLPRFFLYSPYTVEQLIEIGQGPLDQCATAWIRGGRRLSEHAQEIRAFSTASGQVVAGAARSIVSNLLLPRLEGRLIRLDFGRRRRSSVAFVPSSRGARPGWSVARPFPVPQAGFAWQVAGPIAVR